jgi:hypothetical protein
MTPQCWMMFVNKVLPVVHKKTTAVGIINILAEFSIHLQMYQSLTPQVQRQSDLVTCSEAEILNSLQFKILKRIKNNKV